MISALCVQVIRVVGDEQFLVDNYTTTLSNQAVRGQTVLVVRATDADSGENGRVVYSLEHGRRSDEVMDRFSIDPQRGLVTLTRDLRGQIDDWVTVLFLGIINWEGIDIC